MSDDDFIKMCQPSWWIWPDLISWRMCFGCHSSAFRDHSAWQVINWLRQSNSYPPLKGQEKVRFIPCLIWLRNTSHILSFINIPFSKTFTLALCCFLTSSTLALWQWVSYIAKCHEMAVTQAERRSRCGLSWSLNSTFITHLYRMI